MGNEDTVDVIIFKLEALHFSFQNQIWNTICFIFSGWGPQSQVTLLDALPGRLAHWLPLRGEASRPATVFFPFKQEDYFLGGKDEV